MKSSKQASMIALVTCAGIGVAAGCGGDSENRASTGLPPTQLLSDVTPDEARQACERLRDGFLSRFNQQTVVRSACTMLSEAGATAQSSCESLRDACIEEASQPGSDASLNFDAIEFGCDNAEIDEGCGDTTVGELERCFNDTLDLLDGFLNRYSCRDAASVDADDLEGFDFEPAQSCEVVTCGGSPGGLFN